ncbi:hypothetical protein [Falsirhodobacter sp. alg1]|uniref:hypothetical protein n=1 Tax=Falsirhodobacter sp. alg1 TaxID=1472418 RepID=UPI000788436F|nr:hypothetical protein [Falsirhodobacter sp. alg1]
MKRRSSAVIRFGRENWLPLVVFVATTILALWFGTHFLKDLIYFNDPRNVDVDLKGWMTPKFIVMTYDLPRPLVFDFLHLEPGADDRRHLRQVAQDLGISMEELTAAIRERAAIYREGQP